MISVMNKDKDEATKVDSEENLSLDKSGAEKSETAAEGNAQQSANDQDEKNDPSVSNQEAMDKKKRKSSESFKPRRKKPRDAPRRPLSAYNLFFREERAALIARNDDGNPDEDFKVNLDAVVATGKKRDDPSAVFQAAARTLATRWKTMDPKEKAQYEQSAEEEMKRYRARVYEYESRMVEEARQKSSKVDKSGSFAKSMDASAGSRHSKETARDYQGSRADSEQKVDPSRSAQQAQQWIGAQGIQGLSGGAYAAAPTGLNYTLLQPGLQGLAAYPSHQVAHSNSTFTGQEVPSNDALLRMLQSQNQVGGIPPYAAFSNPAPSANWQDPIIAALQRENIFQEQLNAARAANAPVAMTILPAGSVDQQLLLQLLERDRRAREGDTPASRPPSFPPPPHPPR